MTAEAIGLLMGGSHPEKCSQKAGKEVCQKIVEKISEGSESLMFKLEPARLFHYH